MNKHNCVSEASDTLLLLAKLEAETHNPNARLYAYTMQSLKKNQDVLKRMQENGSNTTQIEIDIEAAEYALGMRDDKPKLQKFIEKHCANKTKE
jgi:hypothetical protein